MLLHKYIISDWSRTSLPSSPLRLLLLANNSSSENLETWSILLLHGKKWSNCWLVSPIQNFPNLYPLTFCFGLAISFNTALPNDLGANLFVHYVKLKVVILFSQAKQYSLWCNNICGSVGKQSFEKKYFMNNVCKSGSHHCFMIIFHKILFLMMASLEGPWCFQASNIWGLVAYNHF